MKEPSKVEQMWDRVAGMVPKAAVASPSTRPAARWPGIEPFPSNTSPYTIGFPAQAELPIAGK